MKTVIIGDPGSDARYYSPIKGGFNKVMKLRQTIKNEIKLKNNILKLHEKGLIQKIDVDVYLNRIQDSNNHKQVLDELDRIIGSASYIFNPLESNDSLYNIVMNKEVDEE
ncbi:hypothetical protein FDB37_15720 [Clostridium botulinum]|uniref:hypothetical protein n=1 Tax=Clostridium botulinum TaxID=1491 RepID=UPI0013F0AE2B|nr:hypothetical protein [Clostridium botulinum]MBN1050334.1 hypothetical protein [Clostridium botulinum]NFO35014.1 hypothetical protein [Clostridium botulinum]